MRIAWTGVLVAAIVLAGLCGVSPAQGKEAEGVSLTVYNSNIALVKDNRKIALKQGRNTQKFTDVASSIDATSVHFKSLTDPQGVQILEQNYEYDLVSASKLLEKYIDQPIEIITQDDNSYRGTLMSYDDVNVVVAENAKTGPINMVLRRNIRDIKFGKLPTGLITKPTLVWELACNKAGDHLCKLTYITRNVKWQADYVMVTAADDKSVDLSGWVTVNNRSGATYKNAGLKLIAGDVHRVTARPPMEGRTAGIRTKAAAKPEFAEKAFFEYHMYTLGRRTTIKDRQTKQISLLAAEGVAAKKVYVYNGARYGKKVRVNMEFWNKKECNLGIPLPKGKIRVYKADTDGSLEFIGEDLIDHTPKDEKVRAFLGNAFDLVGERAQMKTRKISRREQEQTF